MADTSGVKMPDIEELGRQVGEAAQSGMQPAVWALLQPDRVAIHDVTGQDRTFGELNANANRIVRLLRAGGAEGRRRRGAGLLQPRRVRRGAVGALRAGMRCTPVNWHLTADEIAYIVNDCEAKAFFADARIGRPPRTAAAQCPNLVLKVAIGGAIAGLRGLRRGAWRRWTARTSTTPCAATPCSTPPAPPGGRRASSRPAWSTAPSSPRPTTTTTSTCAPGPPITPRRWPSTCARRC